MNKQKIKKNQFQIPDHLSHIELFHMMIDIGI